MLPRLGAWQRKKQYRSLDLLSLWVNEPYLQALPASNKLQLSPIWQTCRNVQWKLFASQQHSYIR